MMGWNDVDGKCECAPGFRPTADGKSCEPNPITITANCPNSAVQGINNQESIEIKITYDPPEGATYKMVLKGYNAAGALVSKSEVISGGIEPTQSIMRFNLGFKVTDVSFYLQNSINGVAIGDYVQFVASTKAGLCPYPPCIFPPFPPEDNCGDLPELNPCFITAGLVKVTLTEAQKDYVSVGAEWRVNGLPIPPPYGPVYVKQEELASAQAIWRVPVAPDTTSVSLWQYGQVLIAGAQINSACPEIDDNDRLNVCWASEDMKWIRVMSAPAAGQDYSIVVNKDPSTAEVYTQIPLVLKYDQVVQNVMLYVDIPPLGLTPVEESLVVLSAPGSYCKTDLTCHPNDPSCTSVSWCRPGTSGCPFIPDPQCGPGETNCPLVLCTPGTSGCPLVPCTPGTSGCPVVPCNRPDCPPPSVCNEPGCSPPTNCPPGTNNCPVPCTLGTPGCPYVPQCAPGETSCPLVSCPDPMMGWNELGGKCECPPGYKRVAPPQVNTMEQSTRGDTCELKDVTITGCWSLGDRTGANVEITVNDDDPRIYSISADGGATKHAYTGSEMEILLSTGIEKVQVYLGTVLVKEYIIPKFCDTVGCPINMVWNAEHEICTCHTDNVDVRFYPPSNLPSTALLVPTPPAGSTVANLAANGYVSGQVKLVAKADGSCDCPGGYIRMPQTGIITACRVNLPDWLNNKPLCRTDNSGQSMVFFGKDDTPGLLYQVNGIPSSAVVSGYHVGGTRTAFNAGSSISTMYSYLCLNDTCTSKIGPVVYDTDASSKAPLCREAFQGCTLTEAGTANNNYMNNRPVVASQFTDEFHISSGNIVGCPGCLCDYGYKRNGNVCDLITFTPTFCYEPSMNDPGVPNLNAIQLIIPAPALTDINAYCPTSGIPYNVRVAGGTQTVYYAGSTVSFVVPGAGVIGNQVNVQMNLVRPTGLAGSGISLLYTGQPHPLIYNGVISVTSDNGGICRNPNR